MSYHVTQFYPVLVLRAINAGVRRPGYEATKNLGWIYEIEWGCICQRLSDRCQEEIHLIYPFKTLKIVLIYFQQSGSTICNQQDSSITLASFPGLHTQLLSLAVGKAGEGLDGFIT